jgi:CheY-like chemotaxis protein
MAQVLRVRLLHWNAAAASPTQDVLLDAGFQVEYDQKFDSRLMRKWREDPPAAFVIDLSRLPSQGREIAIALRQSPKTRQVPIIFCDGASEKVKVIRDVLPDATFCTTEELTKTLKSVRPVQTPVKPLDMMNHYGSRTTAQKLGIAEGSTVAIIDPPRNVSTMLGELPGGVEVVEQRGAVTLCFVHSANDLRADMSRVRSLAAKTKLWILWRKKSAPHHDGVTGGLIRETGIDLGLVDYKICSIDNTWSAMLFAQRK